MDLHHNQVVILLLVFAALLTTVMSGGFNPIPQLAVQVEPSVYGLAASSAVAACDPIYSLPAPNPDDPFQYIKDVLSVLKENKNNVVNYFVSSAFADLSAANPDIAGSIPNSNISGYSSTVGEGILFYSEDEEERGPNPEDPPGLPPVPDSEVPITAVTPPPPPQKTLWEKLEELYGEDMDEFLGQLEEDIAAAASAASNGGDGEGSGSSGSDEGSSGSGSEPSEGSSGVGGSWGSWGSGIGPDGALSPNELAAIYEAAGLENPFALEPFYKLQCGAVEIGFGWSPQPGVDPGEPVLPPNPDDPSLRGPFVVFGINF